MGLTRSQLDRLASEWDRKVDIANQNLLDLCDLSAYQRLSGMGNPPQNLSGITQQQASTALTAIARVFEYLELLNQHLDRVRKLRRELPSLFVSDSQLREIEYLLTGMSIDVPSVRKPLAERDLFGDSDRSRSISLSELLDRMAVAFTIARDTFVEIETAWTELAAKSIATNQSLVELQQLTQKLQIAPPSALVEIQTQFVDFQIAIERDPLAVNRAFDRDLIPLINNLRSELIELDRQRQQLQSDLAIARARLQRVREIDREAIATAAKSQSKISHNLPQGAPIPVSELAEMEQWLERLAAKSIAGEISPVRIGLTNWLTRIDAYERAAASALAANRLPLDTRQELRGRFDALTAKALAKGVTENPRLADLALQTRQVLFTNPTDLQLAIDLVRQYERELNRLLGC